MPLTPLVPRLYSFAEKPWAHSFPKDPKPTASQVIFIHRLIAQAYQAWKCKYDEKQWDRNGNIDPELRTAGNIRGLHAEDPRSKREGEENHAESPGLRQGLPVANYAGKTCEMTTQVLRPSSLDLGKALRMKRKSKVCDVSWLLLLRFGDSVFPTPSQS